MIRIHRHGDDGLFASRHVAAAVSRRGLWHTMVETCRVTFPPETNPAMTMDITSRAWAGRGAATPQQWGGGGEEGEEVGADDVQLREGGRNVLHPGPSRLIWSPQRSRTGPSMRWKGSGFCTCGRCKRESKLGLRMNSHPVKASSTDKTLVPGSMSPFALLPMLRNDNNELEARIRQRRGRAGLDG